MTTPTPDNAARATPVAWVERTEGGLTRMWSGDLSAWAGRPANPEPLYSAATVTALEAEVERLRSQVSYEFSERELATRQRDDAWEREAAHKQRADAAERRVAELEQALRAARDKLLKSHSLSGRSHEKAIADYIQAHITGAGAK